MPLYEFKCISCDNVQENIQNFCDTPPECEKCGKETARQISNKSSVNLNFKGTGFYSTDYGKK